MHTHTHTHRIDVSRVVLDERLRILVVLSARAERYVLAARFAVAGEDTTERGVAHERDELADRSRERESGEVIGCRPEGWLVECVGDSGWVAGSTTCPPSVHRVGLALLALTRGRKA